MNVLTVPRTVASLEYTALRLPLTLVQHQVVERFLDEESSLRLGFEKAVGTLDSTVGKCLGDQELRRRGATLSRRADMLGVAATLEDKASTRREEAAAELKQAKEDAAQQRKQAQETARSEAKALRDKQQAERRVAKESAQAEARAKTEAVERETRAKLETEQSTLDHRLEAIDSRTAARTAAPKAQLEDAVQVAADAAKERQTADRLEQLASAEKESRSSD